MSRSSFAGRLLALAGTLTLALAGTAAADPAVQVLNTPAGSYIKKSNLAASDLSPEGQLQTRVMLPTGYDSKKCWPVLYLLHGTGAYPESPAPTEWFDRGFVQQANIPAIVVVPGGGEMWWTDQFTAGKHEAQWEQWVWNVVKPKVDKQYNICAGRDQHSIAGLSMGGLGALYLASQRPDYFGTAASFSGVISLHEPVWTLYGHFYLFWGLPFGFTALTHDPVALVKNLKSTRVLVEAGNGEPIGTEAVQPSRKYEELEFTGMSKDFTKTAKSAGVPVTYEEHAGQHTWPNWQMDIQRFLAWNPFKAPKTPKSWTLSSSSKQGEAWGYRWSFPSWPQSVIKFTMKSGVLTVEGKGKMTLTTPAGKKVKSALPFSLHGAKVKRLTPSKKPLLTVGKGVHVELTVKPRALSGATPLQVSFVTPEKLPAGKVYAVALVSLGTGCNQQTVYQTIDQPAKGKKVSAALNPAATVGGGRTTWCPGSAAVGVQIINKGAAPSLTDLGSILGVTTLTLT